jgi:hypothetical protein
VLSLSSLLHIPSQFELMRFKLVVVGNIIFALSTNPGISTRVELIDQILQLSNPPSRAQTCEALWQEHSGYRRLIYRFDAALDEALYHVIDSTSELADYTLQVSDDLSIARLMSTAAGPALRNMMQALDTYFARSSPDLRSHGEVFSRPENFQVIRQFKSVVRMLQDPVLYHVPLYEVFMNPGFHDRASFESLSVLLSSLGQVRTVVQGNHKVEFLQGLMKTIENFIYMISRAPNHLVGEELRVYEAHHYFNPSITSPRSCRLSEDPVARIERLTREFVESMDFCRGLLFRFVQRETRDRWMDNFHELYDLFEQLLVGRLEFPIATHSVRLAWFDSHESMVRYLARVRDLLPSVTDFSRGDLESMHSDLESFLRGIEQRSSMQTGSLRCGEIDPMEVTVRDTVRVFVATLGPLLGGRQYLTVEEANVVTHAARVAFLSIGRSLRGSMTTITTTPQPMQSIYTPFLSPVHVVDPPRMEWTISEVFGVIGYMHNRESDMGRSDC